LIAKWREITVFSGIVEEVGEVLELHDSSDGRRLRIGAATVTVGVQKGESISVNGTCLTVVDFATDWFDVEAVIETLRRTTLGGLVKGSKVNLERALRLSDRLGGHLVSGHIDAVGKVENIKEEGFSFLTTFSVDPALAPFFVEKGSVAINGVSLTVVDHHVDAGGKFSFRVALIPHTMSVTTFNGMRAGDSVNIETDIIARYVARWMEPSMSQNLNNLRASLPLA
jgi:riboflavin synthase